MAPAGLMRSAFLAISLLLAKGFATESIAACGKSNDLRRLFGGDAYRGVNEAIDAVEETVNTAGDIMIEIGEEVENVVCDAAGIVDNDSECNASIGTAVNQDGEVGLITNDGEHPERTGSLILENNTVIAFQNPDVLYIAVVIIDTSNGFTIFLPIGRMALFVS